MKLALRLALFAAFSVLSGCGESDKSALTIPAETQTAAISKEDAEKAVAIFVDQCKPLTGEYRTDIASAKAKAQNGFADYRIQGYGWKAEIEIQIRTVDNPKDIPNELMSAGQMLTYYVGGGVKPGIIAKSRKAQALCGMTVNPTGGDVFKPVPALSFLK